MCITQPHLRSSLAWSESGQGFDQAGDDSVAPKSLYAIYRATVFDQQYPARDAL